MKAKHKSVSGIASALKGSKRGIHRVLTRVNDFKQKFRSERPRVTTLREDRRIRNLSSTGNYSLSEIKHAVGGKYRKRTIHRRALESEYIKNRKMAQLPYLKRPIKKLDYSGPKTMCHSVMSG